jgi:hypothetical protein
MPEPKIIKEPSLRLNTNKKMKVSWEVVEKVPCFSDWN